MIAQFDFSLDGLSARVRGVDRRRDGAVFAAIDFQRGDAVIFAHSANWTDAANRLAVADVLAQRTGMDHSVLADDLGRLEQLLAANETVPLPLSSTDANRTFWPIPATEFVAEQDEPASPLVEGLIMQGELGVAASKPGVGKTLFGLDLASAVALGIPFLNRETVQGPAVLLQLEDAPSLVRRRLMAMGGTTRDLHVWVGPWQADDPNDFAGLDRFMSEVKPVLVVIDPLIETGRAFDENDAAQMAEKMRPFRQLARTHDATLLLAHHSRKGEGEQGDALRGSSAILGAVDFALELRRVRDLSGNFSPGVLTLAVVKSRTMAEPAAIVIERDPVSLRYREQGPAEGYRDALKAEAIMEVMASADSPLTSDQIATAMGVDRSHLGRPLRALVETGRLVRAGAGKKSDPHRFSVPPIGNGTGTESDTLPESVPAPETQTAEDLP